MARPKSEDKKQALLEAATQAIAQSGIAASTAVIARNAGVAEGTLFRYFATKDELINTLYLHLKQDLCQSMIMELDRSITDAKTMTRFIWNSYISWGLNHPARHRAIRQLAVSEKLTKETEQRADDMFPELRDLCHRSVLMVFMSDEYRAFGDGLFLALAETTMDFAARDPARAGEYIALGFEAMWRALTGTVAKLAMRQPFVLFKGLTFQKLCLPGAFRPGDHHNKMLRPGLCVVHASPQYL